MTPEVSEVTPEVSEVTPEVSEVTPGIWWARVTWRVGDRVEGVGDMFQGPNAEALARAWRQPQNAR